MISGTKSIWMPVSNSDPYESILGPVLLKISVNGSDDGTECKLADNRELGWVVIIPGGCADLQSENLEKQVDRCIKKFNKKSMATLGMNKCMCISAGWRTTGWEGALQKTSWWSWWRIVGEQWTCTARQASSLSWAAPGTASYHLQVEGVILLLCSALGRPQLEDWALSRVPQYEEDVDVLEWDSKGLWKCWRAWGK